MKEHPILFSTIMVNAILSGQKKQTRRVVKINKKIEDSRVCFLDNHFEVHGIYEDGSHVMAFLKKPFTTGNLLWVREEHYRFGYWVKNGFTAKGNQKWKFVATTNEIKYSESKPSGARISRNKQNPENPSWYKRLARFMPKSACRIWLQITNVRVEKLKSISSEDAINEGVVMYSVNSFKDYENESMFLSSAISSFQSLWCKINGKDSWNANPWVWVIEFNRVER